MTYHYDGFVEVNGVFVPQPGVGHPAIEQYREYLELVTLSSTDAVSIVWEPKRIVFVRSSALGSDDEGDDWRWTVWVDQWGRAMGMEDVMPVGAYSSS
jgi:hypothetical protein